MLKVGDIVFCHVSPNDRYFAHSIFKIGWNTIPRDPVRRLPETYIRYFIIGNQAGKENGWCYDHQIYGRLVEVVRDNRT